MTGSVHDHSSFSSTGWTIARAALLGASVLALLSFGGQLILAPILVPLQWGVARRSGPVGRATFLVLAGLLMAEFFVLVGALLSESDTVAAVAGLIVAATATYALYATSAPVDAAPVD